MKAVQEIEHQRNANDEDHQHERWRAPAASKAASMVGQNGIIRFWDGCDQIGKPGGTISPVLQHDPFERVADVFAVVDGVFDQVVQFLPLEHFKSLDTAVKQA